MPITCTATDVQRNMSSVYELCRETRQPVYITKNGSADLVIMDAKAFEETQELQRLVYEREMRTYRALMKSQEEFERGEYSSLSEVLAEMDFE